MTKKLIDVKEIEHIMNFTGCSMDEAIIITKICREHSSAAAYKAGWFDGMRSCILEANKVYSTALDSQGQGSKSGKSTTDK